MHEHAVHEVGFVVRFHRVAVPAERRAGKNEKTSRTRKEPLSAISKRGALVPAAQQAGVGRAVVELEQFRAVRGVCLVIDLCAHGELGCKKGPGLN